MRNGALGLCAFIAVYALALEMAFSNEAIDYWAKETQISEQHLKNFLTQERCYQDENSFLGCIEAFNVLFYNSEIPKLLTNHTTQSHPGMHEIIKEIETLRLQKFIPEIP